jgi:hypothetical protein
MNAQLNNNGNRTPDYASIWNCLQLAKAGINDSLEYVAGVEDATSEIDLTLAERIEAVQGLLNSCIELLKK